MDDPVNESFSRVVTHRIRIKVLCDVSKYNLLKSESTPIQSDVKTHQISPIITSFAFYHIRLQNYSVRYFRKGVYARIHPESFYYCYYYSTNYYRSFGYHFGCDSNYFHRHVLHHNRLGHRHD